MDGKMKWDEQSGFVPAYDSAIMTNADRIRAMSDEEIESWYWWMHKKMMNYTDSRVFVHDWLREEVSDVN